MVRQNRLFQYLRPFDKLRVSGARAGILAAVLLLIAGAVFGVSQATGSSDIDNGEEGVPALGRVKADLVETEVRGKLAFPRTVDLTFETNGIVGAVLVGPQDGVEEGQVLAQLRAVKIAELTEAVAGREVALDAAEDRLADLTRDHNQQLAQARQAQANAKLALSDASTELTDFDLDYQQRLAQARRTKASVELGLDEAREALDDFPSDHLLELAQAQQNKADAGVQLDRALDRLDNLIVEHQRELAAATQRKASADVALDQAQEKLGDFNLDHDQDLARALQAEADSDLVLLRAKDTLDNFHLRQVQELTKAREAVAAAEVAKEAPEDALEAFEDSRALQQTLATQAAVDANNDLNVAVTLVANYRLSGHDPEILKELVDKENRARQEWVITDDDLFRSGIGPAPLKCEDYNGSRVTLHCQRLQIAVELARTDLAQAYDRLAELEALHQAQLMELSAAVELAEANVGKAAQRLTMLVGGPDRLKLLESEATVERDRAELDQAVQDLASLDRASDVSSWPADIALAEADETAAEVALRDAEAALAAMRGRDAGSFALALQEAQVASAQANLAAARRARASIVAGVDPLRVASVAAQITLARETLVKAETSVAKLLDGPNQLDLRAKNSQVTLMEAVLKQAEQDLDNLLPSPGYAEPGLRGRDLLERALLQRSLDLANEDLVKADKDLAELGDSPEQLEVQHLQAQIEHLQAALAEAQEDLNGAFVRAPFSGVVTVVNVEVDDRVNNRSRVVQLVDPANVEVQGVVDAGELDVVRPGANALVTLDSLPGRSLEGMVSRIAAEPRTERGVISYPITIKVDVPQGLSIPVMLSGVTTVVFYEEN